MEKLELTDLERLLLANQYEILGLLKKDDAYSRMAENLRAGYRWLYERHAINVTSNLAEAEVEHVLSILGLYRLLHDSYHPLADKAGIDEHLMRFPGFDGHTEATFLHFSRALTQNGDFTDVIGKDARNSHMPTTDMYRRMIAEWKSMGKPGAPLSRIQILRLVQAQISPGHRR